MANKHMGTSYPFLWGAATSAHQVEGNNIHNDWWRWEQTTPGRIKSGRAADHYRLFKEDFALARELGHNAHCLSLEWSRIELSRGEWNSKALQHYKEVLTVLREKGITTFVALHQVTNPLWFAEKGGWIRQESPYWYGKFVRKVAEELGGLVDYWITFNEPEQYALQAYWFKKWSPEKCDWRATKQVMRNMALAHSEAYRVIRNLVPKARIGITIAYPGQSAIRRWRIGQISFGENINSWFLSLLGRSYDFIGVNYYPESKEVSASADFENYLWRLKSLKCPIYVNGNGPVPGSDQERADSIRCHLRLIEKLQAQGADIRGYFYGSLLDAFDWNYGYENPNGLVAIDFTTMKRTPRPSAYVYRAIIEQARLGQHSYKL